MKIQSLPRKASFLLTSSALALGFCLASARPARAQKAGSAEKSAVTAHLRESPGATKPLPATVSDAEPGHTYWRYPGYDVVLDLWECPEKGVCAKLHSFDEQDPKVRELVGKLLKKNPAALQDNDFGQFCGFEPEFQNMEKKDSRTWSGKIWVKQKKSYFGVAIIEPGPGDPKLHIEGYLIQGFLHAIDPFHVLHKTFTLEPVQNPPPACQIPPGVKPF